MVVSPISSILKNQMRQSCTVYSYEGTAPSGQPEYAADGTIYPCRIAVHEARTVADTGDEITDTGVTVYLPADAEVTAYDRIELPADYEQGAVIKEVVTGIDWQGAVTHKVVRIL